MTIDEAIEGLRRLYKTPVRPAEAVDNAALDLGIEALKLIKEKRGYPEYIISRLLPGETDK